MVKRFKKKKIKISLKRENEILKEMGTYMFGVIQTAGELFIYQAAEIVRLEKKLKKS